MKTDTVKDAAYYEALPYTVTIRKDDEGDFVARIAELPGCIAHGENESSAIENLRSVQRLWIDEALSAGNAIPEPEDDTGLPSGKWVQRVPRRLHRGLVELARRENVSLNQLVTSMLSEAIAVKSCTHALQVFLAHAAEPIRMHGYVLSPLGWPHEPEYGEWRWPVKEQGHTGNIMERLARIKNLKLTPSSVLAEPYELIQESHRQLARK